jgi:hypothetical protein
VPRYLACMYRMRGFGRLTLISGVAGVVGLTLAGCHAASAASPPASTTGAAATASARLSVPGTHKSTTVYRISSPVSTVVVISHVGDVTVIGGGSATVVTQQVAYSSRPPLTSRTISGGTLTVAYTCPAQLVCGVAYVIQVPREVAIQATAGAGSIRLTGLAGSVTAKADVGDITASGLTGDQVSLTTDVGGISATFTAAPSAVEARTRIGGITLRVPGSGAYKVSVHDHLGRVTVSVRQSSSARNAITASTDVGAVLIAPEAA